jgi:hypothetical protein
MLQPAAPVSFYQPTVAASRVVYSYAATATFYWADRYVRAAQAKPAYNNSTAMGISVAKPFASPELKPTATFNFNNLPKASSPINSAPATITGGEYALTLLNAAGTEYGYIRFGIYWGTQIGGRYGGFAGAEAGALAGAYILGTWGLIDGVLNSDDKFAWWEEPPQGQTPYK